MLIRRPIDAVCVVIALVGLYAVHGAADVVVLENGESLSGTFSRVRENTLVFRTSLRGQMMTPMAEVRTLSSGASLYITMMDDRVYYGRLGVAEGRQVILPLDGGDPVAIAASDIKETLPIPSPPAVSTEDAVAQWRLDVAPGAQWRSDRAGIEPSLRLEALGRGDAWSFEGDLWIERADPDDFPAFVRADGVVVRESGGRTRPYIGTGVERDLDRALELRQHLALGLYHELYAADTQRLDAGIALAVEHERHRGIRRSVREDSLRMRLGLRYYRLFAGRHTLSESLMFHPALSDAGAFRARSETVYQMPLTEQLRLRFDLVIDYESDPAWGGLDRWSATIGAGVNMIF